MSKITKRPANAFHQNPPGIISTPKIGTPPNENRVFFDFFDKKKVLARLNAPYKSMCDLYQKAFWFCENFSIFLKIFHISFLSPIQKLFQYDQILSKTLSHVRKSCQK